MIISLAEKSACLRWFIAGEKSVLRSHEPHETATKYKSVLDDLVAQGIIRKTGPYEWRGTDRSLKLGTEQMAAVAKEMGWI